MEQSATLASHSELAIHAAAAIRNGVTVSELEEVVYQAAGYAGFPAAALAREVIETALGASEVLIRETSDGQAGETR
jgi:4-carboxymuconolactone decarboxylase